MVSVSYTLYSQNSLNCQDFRTGHFETYLNGEVSSQVVRNKKYQREFTPKTGVKVKLKINWLSDCSYSLTFIKANKAYHKKHKNVANKTGSELIVEIKQINGLEYQHESRFSDVDGFVYKAIVRKVK